jgi:hypothetical protein
VSKRLGSRFFFLFRRLKIFLILPSFRDSTRYTWPRVYHAFAQLTRSRYPKGDLSVLKLKHPPHSFLSRDSAILFPLSSERIVSQRLR